MKRLTKKQAEERDDVIAKLRLAHEDLTEAIDVFNDKLVDLWDTTAEVREEYGEAFAALDGWLQEKAADMERYQDERSEKWQASDAGEAYEEWQGAYREAADSMDFEAPSIPDSAGVPEIDIPDPDSLPDEPEQ